MMRTKLFIEKHAKLLFLYFVCFFIPFLQLQTGRSGAEIQQAMQLWEQAENRVIRFFYFFFELFSEKPGSYTMNLFIFFR